MSMKIQYSTLWNQYHDRLWCDDEQIYVTEDFEFTIEFNFVEFVKFPVVFGSIDKIPAFSLSFDSVPK